jgi:hypothetical protein
MDQMLLLKTMFKLILTKVMTKTYKTILVLVKIAATICRLIDIQEWFLPLQENDVAGIDQDEDSNLQELEEDLGNTVGDACGDGECEGRMREVIEEENEQPLSQGGVEVFEERAIDEQEFYDEEGLVSQVATSSEIIINTFFATGKKREKNDSSDRRIKKRIASILRAEALERVFYQPIIPLLMELVSLKKFCPDLSFQDLDMKPNVYGDILTRESTKWHLEEMQSYVDTTIGAKEHSDRGIPISLLLQKFCDGAMLHRSREKKSFSARILIYPKLFIQHQSLVFT